MFDNSPFGQPTKVNDPDVIIVADFFAKDIPGGAELTTQALIDSIPNGLAVQPLYCREVTLETLEVFKDKYWIFTNISMLNINLIPTIAANLDYSVIEYDYKFCQYRSIEKHKFAE